MVTIRTNHWLFYLFRGSNCNRLLWRKLNSQYCRHKDDRHKNAEQSNYECRHELGFHCFLSRLSLLSWRVEIVDGLTLDLCSTIADTANRFGMRMCVCLPALCHILISSSMFTKNDTKQVQRGWWRPPSWKSLRNKRHSYQIILLLSTLTFHYHRHAILHCPTKFNPNWVIADSYNVISIFQDGRQSLYGRKSTSGFWYGNVARFWR